MGLGADPILRIDCLFVRENSRGFSTEAIETTGAVAAARIELMFESAPDPIRVLPAADMQRNERIFDETIVGTDHDFLLDYL